MPAMTPRGKALVVFAVLAALVGVERCRLAERHLRW